MISAVPIGRGYTSLVNCHVGLRPANGHQSVRGLAGAACVALLCWKIGSMPSTLFYSWQSDLPNNRNRGLIRRAIDDAITQLNRDLDVEDAIRVDQDTQDEPGSPPITDTILRKIEECAVFVPDVTFVVGGGEDRPTPNPNVMIEYGYALKVCGDRCILPVFNTASGQWEDLPFDMKHKRRPILYEASEEMSDEQRREARRELSTKVFGALKLMADADLLDAVAREADVFTPAEAKDGLGASFLGPDEILGIHRDRFGRGNDVILRLRQGSKIYLRLWPTKPPRKFNNTEVRDLVQTSHLAPMCSARGAGWSYERNKHGAFSYFTHVDDPESVVGVSQLFMTGEIWGIDTYNLNIPDEETNTRFIPTTVVKSDLIDTLINYLGVARDHVGLTPPLRMAVGMVGIAHYRLAVPRQRYIDPYVGDIYETTIDYETQIESYDIDAGECLETLFDQMYDVAGVPKPE